MCSPENIGIDYMSCVDECMKTHYLDNDRLMPHDSEQLKQIEAEQLKQIEASKRCKALCDVNRAHDHKNLGECNSKSNENPILCMEMVAVTNKGN